MVARIGRMDWGAGAWRTLRMKYRSSESVITPLTDRWQGPDRIAPPKRGRHLSQKSPLRKSRIQEFNVVNHFTHYRASRHVNIQTHVFLPHGTKTCRVPDRRPNGRLPIGGGKGFF